MDNIWKACKKWARLSRILGRDSVDANKMGILYKAMVQVVLLFGLEMWVMNLCIRNNLGGFHHRMDHQMICINSWREVERIWKYPPLDKAMAEAWLEEVENMSPTTRTWSHSTLQTVLSRDCVWRWSSSLGKRFPRGGGKKLLWTWWGHGQWQRRQQNWRRRRKYQRLGSVQDTTMGVSIVATDTI